MVEILSKVCLSAPVFTIENNESIPETPIPPRGTKPLERCSNDELDVPKYLNNLKTKKSTAPDDYPRLLKELKQQILTTTK